MKLRESGMPEEAYWESLFDVELILDRLGINEALGDVVELGCGYGTFTIPAAQRISGVIEAIDIEPAMAARTSARAEALGLQNVVCRVADVFGDGFGVEAEGQDACLLFNILHGEEPVRLLTEAAGVLRPGGEVLAIHWVYDPATPRGPAMDIRPRPERIIGWAKETGMLEPRGGAISLPPWHYGLRMRRTGRSLRTCERIGRRPQSPVCLQTPSPQPSPGGRGCKRVQTNDSGLRAPLPPGRGLG